MREQLHCNYFGPFGRGKKILLKMKNNLYKDQHSPLYSLGLVSVVFWFWPSICIKLVGWLGSTSEVFCWSLHFVQVLIGIRFILPMCFKVLFWHTLFIILSCLLINNYI